MNNKVVLQNYDTIFEFDSAELFKNRFITSFGVHYKSAEFYSALEMNLGRNYFEINCIALDSKIKLLSINITT